MAKSRTQRYYDSHPEANARRLRQQDRYQRTAHGTKLRKRSAKAALKIGKVGDGKDVGHTSKGLVLTSEATNRGGKGIHKRRSKRS